MCKIFSDVVHTTFVCLHGRQSVPSSNVLLGFNFSQILIEFCSTSTDKLRDDAILLGSRTRISI